MPMGKQARFRRQVVLVAKWFGTGVLIAGLTGTIYEQVGQSRDRQRLPQIGRSVDIGGRSLNIFCSGAGSPAVILDSGNGDPGYAWSEIQPAIARFTEACWFDRAGEGWSDPGPFPRTSATMSAELHELLHRAGVPPPYVLVGHSLGGLNARVYNGMYAADVAGAVLVDAAHEDEPKRAPAFMLGHTAPRYLWRPIWILGQTARRLGVVRLLTPREQLPTDPAQRTREQVIRALRQQTKAIAAQFDASLPESYDQAAAAGGFGDRPLIVLTAGRVDTSAHPTDDDRQFVAYRQVWMHEIQPKLARLSTRGRQIIIGQSGHEIPREAPEAVIAAARQVVADLRAQQARGSMPLARD
ncbi:MAG TPA: alpha/beta hydrolase [Gemmatimonadales bacterium]|nr:alpha/beta hydrolase [Gemmatimonadales bacterium]